MSLSIYLKNYTGELTNDSDSMLKKLRDITMKKDVAGIQSMKQTLTTGLGSLRLITELCVQACLSNSCETRFKAPLN
jgi:hypothetical protein